MSQQRKQIFIDASITSQRDFDNLNLLHQMAWLHLWISSDNVGVWQPHFRELHFKLKKEIDPDDFLSEINAEQKRIQVLDNNDWWLVNYLPLQVRTLTPTNRPHVSYIEDLHSHSLLAKYAVQNPQHVKFDEIYRLKDYENIEDFDEKKKAKKAFNYLDRKGLVSPLQEACETLARLREASKEKEKEADKEEVLDTNQDQNPTRNSLVANGNNDVFGESSL